MADPWFDPGYKWSPRPHEALKGLNPWDVNINTQKSDWRNTGESPTSWIYRGPNHPLGNKPPEGGGGPPGNDWGDLPELFQPDLYPKSGSYTGLPTDARDQVADRAIPLMLDTLDKLPGQIQNYESTSLDRLGQDFDTAGGDFQRRIMESLGEITKYNKMAYRRYRREGENALESAMPNVLNQLANRNMLNSSVASDSISKVANEIVQTYATKGYESAMATAQQRFGLKQHEADSLLTLATGRTGAMQQTRTHAMDLRQQLPSIMASVGALANYGESFSENPLAPYELLANFVTNF